MWRKMGKGDRFSGVVFPPRFEGIHVGSRESSRLKGSYGRRGVMAWVSLCASGRLWFHKCREF